MLVLKKQRAFGTRMSNDARSVRDVEQVFGI